MPVTATVQRNLPFKHAIDNDEIHHRETYTECPPDQSNAKSVRAGKRLLNGDIADSVAARRQKTRVQSDRGSDQHHSEIHTRTGECPAQARRASWSTAAERSSRPRPGERRESRWLERHHRK